MCWRMIMFVGVIVTAQQLNPHDQSDYVDIAEDEMLNDSVPINDIEARIRKGDKIQDEVEKLLRQPVIHYEEPAAAKTARKSTKSTTRSPTRSTVCTTSSTRSTTRRHTRSNTDSTRSNTDSTMSIPGSTMSIPGSTRSTTGPTRSTTRSPTRSTAGLTRSITSPTRSNTSPTWSISSPTRPTASPTPSSTTKRTIVSTQPSRPAKVAGIPYWGDGEGPGGHSALRQKPTRARQRTTEAVYSVRVGHWDDKYQHHDSKHFHPDVIESLVGAHDIVRFETRPSPMRPPLMHASRHYDPARAPRTWTTHRTMRAGSRTADGGRMREDASTAYIVEQTAHTDKARTGHNATWTAYNEGGIRASADGNHSGPGVRRQLGLVTLPAYLVKATTRRPRPTPTWTLLSQVYPFTRRTRRNPNCTDSYYQCLDYCFDKKGYKVNCPWYTKPTRAEPARINFTGLFWAIQREYRMTEYDASDIFWSWKVQLINKGYRSCRTFTEPPSKTTKKPDPIYYDDVLSPGTGKIMAKCWVCGLRDQGIPHNANCYDNFGNSGSGAALIEKSSYRKYCRWMDEVPLWFNRSDPYSVWGQWTGGCSYRWLDLSGLYAQRACRSTIIPAEGEHYLSRRMARLELALRDEKVGCVVSPMASLVPFSRAVSLYARFHVCVCRGNWCNRAGRGDPPMSQLLIFFVIIRGLML